MPVSPLKRPQLASLLFGFLPFALTGAASLQAGEDARDHWAFAPVPPPSLPATVAQEAAGPIDAWHQALLQKANLPMAAQADRQTLARRLSFHLLGLPPDYADVLAFEDDPSPNAYDRLLDRFLASPRYGERWARHWMDVARYADNKGYVFEEERRYAYAYTYRDWLVSAFNRDLPYDEFLIQQLAGDHVAENEGNRQAYAAMGFLTLGRRFLNRQPDIIDDRIDVVTRGMLGLTVSCARCHDHKFDPIPIEDYYSLYGVFASSDEPDEKPLLGDPDPTSPDYQAFLKESQERQAKIDAFLEERHQKLRTAPILQAYFTLAHEGRNWDEPQIKSRAQRGKLYERVAVQWRDRIRSLCEQEDPAFVPWKTLAEAVGNEPASSRASGDWLEGIWEKSHPLIWTALSQAKVADMPSLIEIYAGVLAAANQATPHADAEKERLRQFLVAEDSPTGIEPERLYRFLNTRDQQTVRRLRRELDQHRALSPGAPPRGMALVDRERPVEPRVFQRGNPASPGKTVPRQYLSVLSGPDRQPFQKGSGRLELARAIASPDNPLTARVFVNRVWTHFFGEPMVDSPSDFGVRTGTPVLVPVLDRLAADFIRHDWSVKRLHRDILLSRLYRQESLAHPEALEGDPENRWLTRLPRQRLGFEAMRDGLLAVSDDLDAQMGGQPVDLFDDDHLTRRRALYGFIDRQNLPSTFRTFDMASPDAHTPQRLETTVPQQALYMMNGSLVERQARRLGEMAEKRARDEGDPRAVTWLYQGLFARVLDAVEADLALQFLREWEPGEKAESAWTAYAQALLSSNEFLFVD